MSVLNQRLIKSARKRHTCDWCGKFIHIAESYIYTAHIYEGDFQVWKAHPECEQALIRSYKDGSLEQYEEVGKWSHERGMTYKEMVAKESIEATK